MTTKSVYQYNNVNLGKPSNHSTYNNSLYFKFYYSLPSVFPDLKKFGSKNFAKSHNKMQDLH